MRWKLTLEYDGIPFVGWQRQDNGFSVQQALEEALFKLNGAPCRTVASGRTDAGVHALGQVVHTDIHKPRNAKDMRDGVNFHLKPHAVVVVEAVPVADNFNARVDALERFYIYRIINRRAPLVLERGRAWFIPVPLDVAAMHEAAQHLVGYHDFTSFRASECQAKSPLRSINAISLARQGDVIEMRVRARSFLHHQVRNMIGTLSVVGHGRKPTHWVKEVLEAKDRSKAGLTAPPDGLYFEKTLYPE